MIHVKLLTGVALYIFYIFQLHIPFSSYSSDVKTMTTFAFFAKQMHFQLCVFAFFVIRYISKFEPYLDAGYFDDGSFEAVRDNTIYQKVVRTHAF